MGGTSKGAGTQVAIFWNRRTRLSIYLGAGLFALSMRNIYDRSVAGSALAVAVMDDLLCWEF